MEEDMFGAKALDSVYASRIFGIGVFTPEQ